MKNKLLHKVFSVVASLSLLANSFLVPFSAYAQETLPPAVEEEATESTSEPTVEASPLPTEEPTPEPTAEANSTPETEAETGMVEIIVAEPISESQPEESIESILPEPDLEESQESSSATLAPSISTDKTDYAPSETVVINGSNFPVDSELTIRVTWPDGVVRNSTGAEDETDSVLTDDNGLFVFFYDLRGEGQEGEYLVEIFMGTSVLATTEFTDTPLSSSKVGKLEQWKTKPTGNWITGALIPGNSDYGEGEVVPFRLDVGGLPITDNPYTFSICRDYKNGANFGYLYLEPYDTSRSADSGGFTITNGPFSGVNVTITSYNEVGGPGVCNANEYETQVTLLSTGAETAYVLWGGHLASPIDPGVGAGNGASSFPGGSLHMSIEPASKDLSIQTRAIIPAGSITIIKDSQPDDSQDFSFTTTGEGLTGFILDDDSDPTLSNTKVFNGLTSGTYTITEESASEWTLASKSCVSSGTGSVATETTNGVSINYVGGEDVTCTFTNTINTGSITVTKYTEPAGFNQFFTFNLGGAATSSTELIDDSSHLFGNLLPGDYTLSEDVPSGWDLSGITCDSESFVNGGTISLSPGEDVFCIFTNTKYGTIIVEKQTDPDAAVGEFTFTGDVSGTIGDGGQLQVGSLLPGTYYSTESDPTPDFDLTNIACSDNNSFGNIGERKATINLEAGETVTCTFTNTQRGSISGHKYEDADGDEGTDGDRTPIEGWVIELWEWVNNAFSPTGQTNTTDASGYYVFNDLLSGSYQVKEQLETGWSNILSTIIDVILDPGEEDTNNDFANFENVTVTACKVVDLDGDIGTTEDQSSYEGWEVNLLVDSQIDDTQDTGVDGCYTWEDLGPGYAYGVSESIPGGWTPLVSPVNYFGSATSGSDYIYIFVNFENITISGYKYNDLDGDGKLDGGEFGLEGWIIYLKGADTGSTPTDVNGYYEFTNLGPGTYTVSEDLKPGWIQTARLKPNYYTVVASSGADVTGKDFYNQGQGSINIIKDVVPYDNSSWNFIVTGPNFYSANFNLFDDGNVLLSPLAAGSYTITEATDEDNYITSYDCGNKGSKNTGIASFELSPGNGVTCVFTNTKYASIGDYIWEDINADGVQDVGEPGIAGISVDLYKDDGDGVFEPGGDDTIVDKKVTDGSGIYIFENLKAGDYWVDVDDTTLPVGYTNTTPDPVGPITLSSGDIYELADVGYVPPTREVQIEKSNDKSGGASAGEEVIYTLVVTNTGEVTVGNIEVIDVLPGGFDYVAGSTLIIGATTVEPSDSDGKLTWSIDVVLAPEDSVTITYQAVISSDIDQGIYINLAACKAIVGGESVENGIGTSESIRIYKPETVWCEIDDSSVPIGIDFTYSDGLRGEVLGAATELPATGNDTKVLIMLLTMLALGASLKVVSYNMAEKKEGKNV